MEALFCGPVKFAVIKNEIYTYKTCPGRLTTNEQTEIILTFTGLIYIPLRLGTVMYYSFFCIPGMVAFMEAQLSQHHIFFTFGSLHKLGRLETISEQFIPRSTSCLVVSPRGQASIRYKYHQMYTCVL